MTGDRLPLRQRVVVVAEEEAQRARIALPQVLGASKRLPHSAARKRAWVRLVVTEGFSVRGVALTWGCDRKCIQRALREVTAR